VAGILKPVAMKYCIPMTSGRGYCSLPPRYDMARRFRKSGKERLVVIIVSDFDPDGETIAESFARSMRDDFAIKKIDAIKAALTYQQTQELTLPPAMKAKKRGAGDEFRGIAKKFVEKYGENVYELEAIPPEKLQEIVTSTIDSVLDVDAFNYEVAKEREDCVILDAARRRAHAALRGVLSDTEEAADE
jgi:hypothetical protein